MKTPVKLAIKGDKESLDILFSQFLASDEHIAFAEYYGFNGLWHMGYYSFGCLTDRRVCSLKIGWLGSIVYSDGFLEDINSVTINQPSLFVLYLLRFVFIIFTFGIGIILLPLFVRLYYRFVKSGMTANIRGGGKVNIFCDREKIKIADNMLRLLNAKRESRLSVVFSIQK
jgi:hypothetical protein